MKERVYALPPEDRTAKVDVHARPGIFLGYKKSMKLTYYVDATTGTVKTARHVAFDEGMNDSADPPPYVRYLRGDLDPEHIHLDDSTPDMQVSLSPFNEVDIVTCDFHSAATSPLGLEIGRCDRYLRAYARSFTRPFGPHPIDSAHCRYLGGYVLKVGEFFTFTPADVARAVAHYANLPTPPSDTRCSHCT